MYLIWIFLADVKRKLNINDIPFEQFYLAAVTRPFYFSGGRRIKGSATPD